VVREGKWDVWPGPTGGGVMRVAYYVLRHAGAWAIVCPGLRMLGGCLFQFSGREFPPGGASVLVELFARGFIGQIWPARVENVTGT
jgi:hypothetical protein